MTVPAARHPLVACVARRLTRRCGVPRGANLVVGCSGGADSVALLVCCAVIAARERARGAGGGPLAVHVHHHLRGEDADADAAFVEDLCRSLDVPCEMAHVRPAGARGNTAAAARRLRYAALVAAARAHGAAHVAVAHHAEDQMETVLMALCRGAGLDGLAGMRWTGPPPGGEADVALVRPLLDVPKARCADLCRTAGIGWREDPGNVDPARARARLRRDVIPVLEELWPGAAPHVSASADIVRAAAARIAQDVEQAFGAATEHTWERAALRRLAPPIVGAGLRRAAESALGRRCGQLGRRHLGAAAEAITSADLRPHAFDWPAGLRLHVDARSVRLERAG